MSKTAKMAFLIPEVRVVAACASNQVICFFYMDFFPKQSKYAKITMKFEKVKNCEKRNFFEILDHSWCNNKPG